MRLIDADKFEVVAFENKSDEFIEGAQAVLEMIDAAPTIEAEPVKHGRWVKQEGQWRMMESGETVNIHLCSCCGGYFRNAPYNYCPNCGAKMDGDDNHE